MVLFSQPLRRAVCRFYVVFIAGKKWNCPTNQSLKGSYEGYYSRQALFGLGCNRHSR
jgi:hypothetical protein